MYIYNCTCVHMLLTTKSDINTFDCDDDNDDSFNCIVNKNLKRIY